jgi:hypothetical protein
MKSVKKIVWEKPREKAQTKTWVPISRWLRIRSQTLIPIYRQITILIHEELQQYIKEER